MWVLGRDTSSLSSWALRLVGADADVNVGLELSLDVRSLRP